MELDANIMGRVFPGLGFLIVRDLTGTPIATRKMEVPDVSDPYSTSKSASTTLGRAPTVFEAVVRRGGPAWVSSAIVNVLKKTGEMRMCVDYHAVNAKTPRDAYPLPRIEKALDILCGVKFFCSLDLAHGYYQIPIAKEDIHKTSFRSGTEGV